MAESKTNLASEIRALAEVLPSPTATAIVKALEEQGKSVNPAQVSMILKRMGLGSNESADASLTPSVKPGPQEPPAEGKVSERVQAKMPCGSGSQSPALDHLKTCRTWSDVSAALHALATKQASQGEEMQSPWAALRGAAERSRSICLAEDCSGPLMDAVDGFVHGDLDLMSRVIVAAYAITDGHPELVETLDLGPAESVEDIEAVKCLSGLKSFSIDQSQSLSAGQLALTDLSPLSQLRELRELSLTCGASDLSPLASLPHLRALTLVYCDEVSDTDLLGRLPALEELCLDGCQGISDLEPIAKSKTLQRLTLASLEAVEDLTPLRRKGFSASVEIENMEHAEGCEHWDQEDR